MGNTNKYDEYPVNLIMEMGYLVAIDSIEDVKTHLPYVLSTLTQAEQDVLREI